MGNEEERREIGIGRNKEGNDNIKKSRRNKQIDGNVNKKIGDGWKNSEYNDYKMAYLTFVSPHLGSLLGHVQV